MSFLRHLAILLGLVLATASGACAEGVLRYAGATTLQRFFLPEVARLFTNDTAIRVQIKGGNTDPGLSALLAGEIEIAGAGRLLTAAEKNKGLVEHFLGWDVLAVVVHEQNPLDNLSLEQLQGIFSGTLSNWKEVGGSDTPIVVVTCPQGSGMRSAVQSLVLREKDFLVREIVSAIVAEADQQVSMFPGAITVLSRSMLDAAQVKSIMVDGVAPTAVNVAEGRFPLIKPLLLVTRGEPQGDLARFIALLKSPQSRALLEKSFVPMGP